MYILRLIPTILVSLWDLVEQQFLGSLTTYYSPSFHNLNSVLLLVNALLKYIYFCWQFQSIMQWPQYTDIPTVRSQSCYREQAWSSYSPSYSAWLVQYKVPSSTHTAQSSPPSCYHQIWGQIITRCTTEEEQCHPTWPPTECWPDWWCSVCCEIIPWDLWNSELL